MRPQIAWQELSDDELEDVLQAAEAERMRRWHARRRPSFVDDLRTRLMKEGGSDGRDATGGACGRCAVTSDDKARQERR